MAEKTKAQVRVSISSDNALGKTIKQATYKKFRTMRRDPTISLARKLLRAGIMVGDWSVVASEDAPEGAVDFVDAIIQPMRAKILRDCITAWLDFGWQPWERIAVAYPELENKWGFLLKPLLQDVTDILVEANGDLLGVRQETTDPATGQQVKVDLAIPNEVMVFSFDVEGTDWYGTPLMWDSESAYDKWEVIEEAATRYDAKVAGTHWVVYYPVGVSDFNGREDVDNYEIAQSILNAIQSSGMMAIPKDLDKFVQDNVGGIPPDFSWKVEMLTDSSAGRGAFTERQKYLDALKVRGLGLPERSILEGQFGTKAEASAHGDFAISNIELMHSSILEMLNDQGVDWLLRTNYGPAAEGTVWVEAAPLADKDRSFLQTLYQNIAANPDTGAEEVGNIDMEALRDTLTIPSSQQVNPFASGIGGIPGQDPTALV